jgi:DNA-directed RNA polymerase subunit M/transcription elongation factor TFIIS
MHDQIHAENSPLSVRQIGLEYLFRETFPIVNQYALAHKREHIRFWEKFPTPTDFLQSCIVPLEVEVALRFRHPLRYRSQILHLVAHWREEPSSVELLLNGKWEDLIKVNFEKITIQKSTEAVNIKHRDAENGRKKIEVNHILGLNTGEHSIKVSKCSKCGSENVIVELRQDRGADEPESRYILCQEKKCGHSRRKAG